MGGISMKNLKTFILSVLFITSATIGGVSNAQAVKFDMLNSTPVGSWQVREDINTDHKGRQTVSTIKTTMLGKESRNGQDFYWIEMVMQNYKLKRGKRKKTGKQAIVKSLMPSTVFDSDPANILTNMRGLGEELIIQNGKEKPMRISGAGGFLSGLMKGLGAEINYKFTEQGRENISVAGGSFGTTKIHGVGNTEMKIMLKKIKVESDSTVWIASDVPFGMIKSEGHSTSNGKRSDFVMEMQEYGMSGGTSLITEEPSDMPSFKNPFAK